ncbi:hypothetical protein RND81_08G114800 [Saponaria officinalis]|uniref:Uncharacterized protein n=1 Tax=Saponaria officinalis TaxID=3572 RepID=A0AAW1J5F1_SAPOF
MTLYMLSSSNNCIFFLVFHIFIVGLVLMTGYNECDECSSEKKNLSKEEARQTDYSICYSIYDVSLDSWAVSISGVFIDHRYFYLKLDGKLDERQFDPSNRFVV